MLPSVCSFGKRNKCSIDFMWVYMSWKPFDYFGEEMEEIKIKSVFAKSIGLLLQYFYSDITVLLYHALLYMPIEIRKYLWNK